MSQQKYTLDLLKETRMLGCKPSETPIEHNRRLGDSPESTMVNRGQYQHLVRKLIYLSHTQLDIAYVVSVVSQFMYSPRQAHLEAVYKVRRYLNATLGKGILFKKIKN